MIDALSGKVFIIMVEWNGSYFSEGLLNVELDHAILTLRTVLLDYLYVILNVVPSKQLDHGLDHLSTAL